MFGGAPTTRAVGSASRVRDNFGVRTTELARRCTARTSHDATDNLVRSHYSLFSFYA